MCRRACLLNVIRHVRPYLVAIATQGKNAFEKSSILTIVFSLYTLLQRRCEPRERLMRRVTQEGEVRS